MLFISRQKLFSFSKYLSFCLDVLVMQQNGLIRKIRLTSNFMTSQPGQQTIVIHILVNILRSKGSQTMKFAQLISSNMRNTLLSRSYTKCGGETSPRLFSEKLKLSISLIQQSKSFIQFVFIVCQVEGYIETKLQNTCFYHSRVFLIIKGGLVLASPVSFLA